MARYDAAEIEKRTGGRPEGDLEVVLEGVSSVGRALENELTWISDERHAAAWAKSRAGCVVVGEGFELPERAGSFAVIRVEHAELAMVTVLGLFAPDSEPTAPGVHPSAVVHESARLGEGVTIGPFCRVGRDTSVGDGTVLIANVQLGAEVGIGAGSTLHPGVVIGDRCSIGSATTLHANVVIGTDGFGYLPAADGGGLVKIPHIGTVEIGSDVEIGAGTCIDRGKFAATRVGDGTKIDNLCQIGHNCEIGRCCVLCGQVGIAGSTTIGDGTMIGGSAGLADHLTIGRGVSIGAFSGVISDIPDGETWLGIPAGKRTRVLREHAAIRRLPDWARILRPYIDREQPPAPPEA